MRCGEMSRFVILVPKGKRQGGDEGYIGNNAYGVC